MDGSNSERIFNAFPELNLPGPEGTDGEPQDELPFVISGLSRLFFSIYYVSLENDTYRAVIRLRRTGDVLGDEVGFTSALQIYASHFVHPDDRARYLQVMNVDNLKRELRWWKPTLAVEYRRSVDDPVTGAHSWSWVRATAVLARTGADELPLTAVYVVQDINDGRQSF